jgi:hypothetical protein
MLPFFAPVVPPLTVRPAWPVVRVCRPFTELRRHSVAFQPQRHERVRLRGHSCLVLQLQRAREQLHERLPSACVDPPPLLARPGLTSLARHVSPPTVVAPPPHRRQTQYAGVRIPPTVTGAQARRAGARGRAAGGVARAGCRARGGQRPGGRGSRLPGFALRAARSSARRARKLALHMPAHLPLGSRNRCVATGTHSA